MDSTGDSVPSVADPRVQAALERIADSAGIDLNAMPQVLEDVYRRLNAALADSTPNGQADHTGGTDHTGGNDQSGEGAQPEPSQSVDGLERPDVSA